MHEERFRDRISGGEAKGELPLRSTQSHGGKPEMIPARESGRFPWPEFRNSACQDGRKERASAADIK